MEGGGSSQAIDRDELYDHERHGRVEVTGIWQGVYRVDEAKNKDVDDTIIVNYTLVEDDLNPELTTTLDEFTDAIE